MSGAGLTYNFSALDGVRQRVVKIGRFDRRALLDLIGGEVESQTRRRIEAEKEGPDGEAWPEWSDRHAASRHSGQSMLEGEGMLLASMGYAVHLSGDQVEVGSNLIYAATHQFGDPERNIPARPYLGLSAENEADLEAVVDDFLARVAP